MPCGTLREPAGAEVEETDHERELAIQAFFIPPGLIQQMADAMTCKGQRVGRFQQS